MKDTSLILLSMGLAVGFAVFWWGFYYLGPRFRPHYRYFKQRHKEHESGWRVLLDGQCVAELDYLRDDQPFHLFSLLCHTDDQSKIDHALRSAGIRDPDPRIEFENRASGRRVPDGQLLACLRIHPDTRVESRYRASGRRVPEGQFLDGIRRTLVSIRDFRTPSDSLTSEVL